MNILPTLLSIEQATKGEGQSNLVYSWEILWDRCEKNPEGGPWDRWIPREEKLSLAQGRKLVEAASRLYGLPTPQVETASKGILGPGRAYYLHPDMILYLPECLDGETVLHEYGHYMVDQSADFHPEFIPAHGPLFARYVCDLGVAFGYGEGWYLQKLGEACGVRFAMGRDGFVPESRERDAGLRILEEM